MKQCINRRNDLVEPGDSGGHQNHDNEWCVSGCVRLQH